MVYPPPPPALRTQSPILRRDTASEIAQAMHSIRNTPESWLLLELEVRARIWKSDLNREPDLLKLSLGIGMQPDSHN